MDPFEVRMQFLTLLRRLDATQASIKKIVAFALKYFASCGEDLWDCIMEECQTATLNNRVNMLYLVDMLCETCLLARPPTGAAGRAAGHASYVDYVARDLHKLAECVVPPGQHGMPNFMSTVQVLENWRTKRVIDPQRLDEVLGQLESRRATATLPTSSSTPSSASASSAALALDPQEIKKRMEEDRERHKRLRERRWVQPISHNLAAAVPPLASFLPLTDDTDGVGELTLDIEFENEWEATSDWNEDDDEAIAEENLLCFPPGSAGGDGDDGDDGDEQAMDLS